MPIAEDELLGGMSTLQGVEASLGEEGEAWVPALTILSHPEVHRIGERVLLPALARRPVALSRGEPEFRPPRGGTPRPLVDPFLSRNPLTLVGSSAGITIVPADDATPISIGRSRVTSPTAIGMERLARGVPLVLAERVVLLLHRLPPGEPDSADRGMIGASPGLEAVRAQIGQVADLDLPILIRGETGTGKELVAQAIHAASPRARRPCVCVNMAAIGKETAASTLFGHARGAFTSAVREHDGHFVSADGGTLFLDEVGDTSPEVQALLLRALETGEVQPLGSAASRRVDVRLVAATDLDLQTAIASGRFREPLYHRLARFVITLPPLRTRLDDLGRLAVHFLRAELAAVGAARLLETNLREPRPPLSTSFFLELLEHPWPGNVRELRNLMSQMAIASRGKERLSTATLRQLLRSPAEPRPAEVMAEAPPTTVTEPRRQPISDEELVRVLREHDYSTVEAARTLGISRNTLNGLIQRSPRLRMAREIPAEELQACVKECGGDVRLAAERLGISVRALRLRLTEHARSSA